MAGGWARDGAVSEQIEASISDELARMQAQKRPVGESLTHCAECEEPIPEKRRQALPGVKLCPGIVAILSSVSPRLAQVQPAKSTSVEKRLSVVVVPDNWPLAVS